MKMQKEEIIRYVEEQKMKGQSIQKILSQLGVKRSTYYRWKNPVIKKSLIRTSMITPEEKRRIEEVKEMNPQLRHRQIQGILQGLGLYLSPSVVYEHLRSIGKIEHYERRPSPWEVARYEPCKKNKLWGADWSRLKIGWLRWYLLAVIDYYSRVVVAYDIVPSVNASHVKRVYQAALKKENISLKESLPELRVDRGAPNTAHVTREFFEEMGAELSFSRVNRPTDNARTERLFGTIKQEEIYVVGNYPDEISARREIGQYLDYYHHRRPHQGLWNFTPAYVHHVNNKSQILDELNKLKINSKHRRKQYWTQINHQEKTYLIL
jgi:transposase InsO family protein